MSQSAFVEIGQLKIYKKKTTRGRCHSEKGLHAVPSVFPGPLLLDIP